ncbi:hypothetical protein QBZ16_005495 [Prototheca wickerhamii]|uniref:PA domain-containing protein n=1 Tax=Prototheca wickerhamii TaxID=3111 RepID=A0AAD9IGD5_PROWI|nr:hypothetical protein QBZ16_005495 [Prototheca wickerhamii]
MGAPSAWVWAVLLVAGLGFDTALGVKQDCYGAWVDVRVRSSSSGGGPAEDVHLYGYPSDIGLPIPARSNQSLVLDAVEPADGCGILESAAPGRAALVRRGACDFLTKARRVAAAGYEAMVLEDTESAPGGCVFMSSNDTAAARNVSLHLVTVTAAAGERLASLARLGKSRVSLSAPPPGAYGRDWSTLLLEAPGARADDGADDGVVLLTRHAAASFIVVASATLLLLFWLRGEWVVEALSLVFALGAWQPVKHVLEGLAWRAGRLSAGAQRAVEALHANRLSDWFLGGVRVLSAAAGAASLALCAAWLLHRDAPWNWALQDLLSLCLLVTLLRSCLLPDLSTAAILLPLAFVYDVWWVFIQPRVTGGPSVMVEVAAGGGAGPRLPMVLLAPQPGPGDNPAMAVLGLGDVALPGLLIVLLARWDAVAALAAHRARSCAALRGYAAPAIAAFAAGLALTYTALRLQWFGDAGQPALLYLVPCVLGTTCLLAAARGELRALWEADLETPVGRKFSGEVGLDPRAPLLAV